MMMEDDRFTIPERYLKMSVEELKKEKEEILEELKKKPRNVKPKKGDKIFRM